MELTAEQELMAAAMRMYLGNTMHESLNLSNYIYEPREFLNTVKVSKSGGIIYSLIKEGKITGFPARLQDELTSLYQAALLADMHSKDIVGEVAGYAKKKGVKCIFGGSYVVSRDYCARGDLNVDELTVYLDKDIDLIQYSKSIKIEKIIKDAEFFNDYYSKCLFVNLAPIDVLYEDTIKKLEKEHIFCDKYIAAYILHYHYIDKCRRTVFKRVSLSNSILDKIFEENLF